MRFFSWMSMSFKDLRLWLVFFMYMILLGVGCFHHEMWGDELHSCNLSKGSGSYSELIFNRRYEGHPPGWYTLLWILSKFTHKVAYIQVLPWSIAVTTVFVL